MAWQARSFTQIWMLDTPMISAAGPCLPHHPARRVGPQTPRRRTLSPTTQWPWVRTLKGIVLTDSSPRDHRHHYGLSIAVADVNGTSHWGGRSFVRDEGPTLLQNHGRQVSGGMRAVNGNATESGAGGRWLVDDVQWFDQYGALQLREERLIGGVLLPEVDSQGVGSLRARSSMSIRTPTMTSRSTAKFGHGSSRSMAMSANCMRTVSARGEELRTPRIPTTVPLPVVLSVWRRSECLRSRRCSRSPNAASANSSPPATSARARSAVGGSSTSPLCRTPAAAVGR